MSLHVARGPLSSSFAQWAVLGVGVVAIAGKENVSAALQRAVHTALQASVDGSGAVLGNASPRTVAPHGQVPIVIHSGPAAPSGSSRFIGTLLQLTVGATACWASYVVISTCLPDAVKELMPVTRRFFDAAITSLGQAVISVRDALADRLDDLGHKQEELSIQQDATHSEVLAARDDLDGLRLDLESICASVRRCEDSLAAAERRQTYTARGVRLLVRCVSALLPGNATLAGELDKFGRETAEEYEEEEQAGDGGGVGGGDGLAAAATASPSAARTPAQSKDALVEMARRREEYRKQQQQQKHSVRDDSSHAVQTPGKNEIQRMDSIPECTGSVTRELSREMSVEDLLSSIKAGNFTVRA